MPQRNNRVSDDEQDDRRSRFQQRHQQGATSNQSASNKRATAPAKRKNTADDEDDVWDDIMSTDTSKKGSYDSDGPNKMSLNYWLSPGETDEISFLDNKPAVFQGHTIRCVSPNSGKTFYRNEACGKATGQDCAFCDQCQTNKNISKAKRLLCFRIVSSRGVWNKDDNGFDEVPALKFMFASTELAQQIGVFKSDENIDGITNVAFTLVKNEKYTISPKMVKRGASLFYAENIETEDELVEVEDIYYPMEYEEAEEFIDQFVPTKQAEPAGRNAGRGNQKGSFYGNRGGSNSGGRGANTNRRGR